MVCFGEILIIIVKYKEIHVILCIALSIGLDLIVQVLVFSMLNWEKINVKWTNYLKLSTMHCQ